jgi:hypothetical protein
MVAGLALAGIASPAAAADPLTLFLLRMLRDQVISRAIEAGVSASQSQPQAKPEVPVPSREPVPPEGQWLRGLIDESYAHLNAQQREELHASLMRILADPKNAAVRADIIAEFTRQSIAMRDAHRQLSRLSESDMKTIAVEARQEFERLPPEQRQQLMQALRQGVPGVPRALHDMMMAEFSSVSAAPR